MTNTYTDTATQLIINDITDVDISTVTFNADELYLTTDNAVYSVNNITPVNGNVTLDVANKDLSNLSTTGNAKFHSQFKGGASTITSSDLTANRALISNSSGKVAVSAVTSSQLGYLSTVTSNVQTQLNGKQPTLVSGTNIKTINSTSLLGGGNISVGTVTSVNNVSPVNGNVSLTVPTKISDLTDDTSTNPVSNATVADYLTITTVGSATQPIYLYNGAPVNCTYTLEKSVPSNAVFTDTTYSAFTGATSIAGGASGLVPAPSAGDNDKILTGGATWSGLKTVNSTSLLGSGNIDTSEIFVATYNTTSYADVLAAYNAGKQIFVKYDNNYPLATLAYVGTWQGNITYFEFSSLYYSNEALYNLDDHNVWTENNIAFVNSNLSNISTTGKKVLDGQWVPASYTLLSSSTTAPTSDLPPIDISDYLPDDSYAYEVLLMGAVETAATSGKQTRIILSTSLAENYYMVSAITRTNATNIIYGTCIMPVGSNREITVKGYSNNTGSISLYMRAYRRIGTNS